MHDDLLPIGRFSRMSRLSVKALRRYADLGLLRPARVDAATGYRYYHPGQANRAEAIRVLRQVDMPLEQIRELLLDDDRETIAKRLMAHRERLEERLAEQERMLRFLQRLIDTGGHVMPYEVTIGEAPAQFVISWATHTTLATVADDIGRGFAAVVGSLTAAGAEPAGAPFIVYHDVIDEHTDGTIEICIPVPPGSGVAGEMSESADAGPDVAGGAPPDETVRRKQVPGSAVARTMHRGPYDEIGPAYHAITGWIHEHDHQVVGPPREIYLNDPESVLPQDLLTEVQFPIAQVS